VDIVDDPLRRTLSDDGWRGEGGLFRGRNSRFNQSIENDLLREDLLVIGSDISRSCAARGCHVSPPLRLSPSAGAVVISLTLAPVLFSHFHLHEDRSGLMDHSAETNEGRLNNFHQNLID